MLPPGPEPNINSHVSPYPHTYKHKKPQKNLQGKQKAKAMKQEGVGRGGAGGDGGDQNQQQQQLPPPQETMQRGEAAQVEVQAEVQPEAQGQPQAPPRLPQQPVQCPRCDSLNTKFCYYNNYSMSQPRYFCKTCRRYWTHGGTLRNVPVGGGCRKGKRGAGAKNSPSSSSENSASSSRSNQQQPQPPSQDQLLVVQAQPPNLTPMVGARDPPPSLGVVPSVTPFFQGGLGGYLSSLGVGGIHHSLSLNPSHPFDQALMNAAGVGDVGVGGSNLGVVSGFNVANSPGPLRSSQYFQLGGAERDVGPLYAPAEQQSLIPSTMAANSSAVATHRDWTHRFITNAANNIRATDGSMWSTVSTTNVSGNSQRNVAAATGSSSSSASGSALMMPNQWPNVPGFGPPPSSF